MLVVDVTSMCLVVHEWFKNLARSFFARPGGPHVGRRGTKIMRNA